MKTPAPQSGAAPVREASTSPTEPPTPTTTPEATASPAAAPEPSPPPTGNTGGSNGSGGSGGSGSGGSGGQPTDVNYVEGCTRLIRVTSIYRQGNVSVMFSPNPGYCTSQPGRVFWVSYAATADGSGVRFASATYSPDLANPSVSFHIDLAPGCETWFVVVGTVGIKQTLSAAQMRGEVNAYPGTGPWAGSAGPTDSIHYNVDPNCHVPAG